eukprot:CAMPEP_0195654158 /NCGR_PEP_ID=MMETSP0815-20121206/33770_1 /TAXON_ID=97485 /ORGANISM="Prymnesium parvum, Strain Texoma1" /LENGTH=91 /DNA_ID=CAMNT_0040798349 /DNA_START=263 /DNA_END=538 /DNA_ORIENTATION=-
MPLLVTAVKICASQPRYNPDNPSRRQISWMTSTIVRREDCSRVGDCAPSPFACADSLLHSTAVFACEDSLLHSTAVVTGAACMTTLARING